MRCLRGCSGITCPSHDLSDIFRYTVAERRGKENVDEHGSENYQEQGGLAEPGADAGKRVASLQDDGLLAG